MIDSKLGEGRSDRLLQKRTMPGATNSFSNKLNDDKKVVDALRRPHNRVLSDKSISFLRGLVGGKQENRGSTA